MRWFVVASVAVWSASALAADVSDGGVIPLPPVVVPLGAADVPNASSPTQRDPSATTTVIETKSRVAEAKDAAELIAASWSRLAGPGRRGPTQDAVPSRRVS